MFAQKINNQLDEHILTWNQVSTKLQADERGKYDITTDKIWMAPDGTLEIDGQGGFELSNEVQFNVLNRFCPNGATYLKKCSPELKAYNVNHWLAKARGQRLMVRVKETDERRVVRAVLSERYAKLDNPAIMEHVIDHLQDTYVPVSLELTDHAFQLRLVRNEQADIGKLNVGDIAYSGLIVANSETGMGALRLHSLLYRLKCKNGMVGGDESAYQSKSHLGKTFEMREFFNRALEGIHSYFPFLVRQLRSAHEDVFLPEQAMALVSYLGKRQYWNQAFISNVQTQLLVEDTSKFGLVQAITEMAKTHPPEDRLRFERQASGLLRHNMASLAEHVAKETALIATG